MDNKNIKILIIIPAFNEDKSILNTYKSIIDYNKEHNSHNDVIVINDGSIDNTKSILENNAIPHVNLPINSGIGAAVQTGHKYAKLHDYDIAIQYDGDGQHDVSYIKNITQPIISDKANLVIGSRFVNATSSNFKSSRARRAGIKIISLFIKILTGKKIYDTTSGFRAADKKVIDIFASNYPSEYPEPISSVTLLKNKFIIDEVPVSMNERTEGTSSIKAWKSIYYMFNVVLSIIIESIGGYKNEY